jgi:predicted  nucleic acid-binding Zn-ribbon protein
MKESNTKIREIVDKNIISHLSVSIDESEKKFKKISEEFDELKKTKFTKTEEKEKLKIHKSDSMEEIKKLEEFFSDFSSMKNSPPKNWSNFIQTHVQRNTTRIQKNTSCRF